MQKTCHDLLHDHDQMGSGYIVQPATQSIRLSDLQTAFPKATGTGVVAVLDTGVDTAHPALQSALLPGYDFTRNARRCYTRRTI